MLLNYHCMRLHVFANENVCCYNVVGNYENKSKFIQLS